MGSAEAIIELFALIAAVIFGYFQIIVPFLKGDVRLSRHWPFVEDVREITGPEAESPVEDRRPPDDREGKGSRLAHVMFADMVGYIPLTLEDDALAQELLNEYIRILRSVSAKHGGTELKVFGDEFLIEFPAPIEATMCAVELLKVLSERNAGELEDRKIRARAGVHSGYVEIGEGEVAGEAVDVVARVERLAGSGGICMTESVYRRVRNKIGMPILKLGRGARKEVRSDCDIFRLIMPWEAKRLTYGDRFSMALQHTGYRVLTSIGLLVAFMIIFFVGYLSFSEEIESGEPIPIAVVDFLNQTGETDLDGLSGMLITALEQSRRLSVLTRARMFDILRQMGKEDIDQIDESLGKEICRKANLDALVIASIRRFGELYTIDLQVLDPDRDEYIFTAREEGKGKQSIPAMVDRLSERTRIGLNERQAEIQLTSQRIADVTTPNLEAYQHYFEGEEYLNKLQFEKARDEFLKAIALDSTFALAHYRLAYTSWWTLESEQVQKVQLQRAVELIDQVPEKEQYLIRADMVRVEEGYEEGIKSLKEMEKIYPNDKEMLYNIGDWSFHLKDYKTAMEYLERVLEMDPYHERTLQHLTWTYAALNQIDRMGEVARQFAEVDEKEGTILVGQYHAAIGDIEHAEEIYNDLLVRYPEHPEALRNLAILYGNRCQYDRFLEYAERYAEVGLSRMANTILGWAYMGTGNFKKASKKFQKAREINPKDLDVTEGIAFLYLLQGRPDLANKEFEALIEKDMPLHAKLVGYRGLQHIHIYLGEYEEALRISDLLIDLMVEESDTARLAMEYMIRGALRERGWGDLEGLREELERSTRFQGQLTSYGYWGFFAISQVLLGEYPTAERIAEERMSDILWFDEFLRFYIHVTRGEFDKAIPISDYLLSFGSASVQIQVNYVLADGYYRQGKLVEAIAAIERMQGIVGGDLTWAIFYPRSFYLLGKVYEEGENIELARANYGIFLEIWKNADEDLPDLLDAEMRLANLGGLALK